jgi:ribulose-phosphate 3-epimerase
MKVVPAIIPHTRVQIEEEFKKVKNFVDLVQVDITDGDFVPTKTWPYNGRDLDFFENLKGEKEGWPFWDSIDIELHLMIRRPEETLMDWIKTGISTVIFHIEATEKAEEIINICKENSIGVGVAIKPATDISRLETVVSKVDFIQVMGSDTLGKHDVHLEDKAVEQIKKLRETYPESIIAIDIGVNEDTAESLIDSGVNKFVSGGFILESENPEEAYQYLESLK